MNTLALSRLIDAEFDLPAAIGLADESKAIRHALLTNCEVQAIATRDDANAVGESARSIRTHIKEVRQMAMDLRRPLKALQDRIKSIEDEYCVPLEERQAKLENLVTAYAKAEDARVQEELRKRREEVARIERERIEAERKALEEKQRIEREAREAEERTRQAAQAGQLNAKELFRVGMEEERRRQEAEEARLKAEAEIEKARAEAAAKLQAAVAAPIEEHKVAGAATRRVLKWELIDQNALFKARPELFKVELKKSAVNATCFPKSFENTAENPDTASVPGLKLWYENETVIRAY